MAAPAPPTNDSGAWKIAAGFVGVFVVWKLLELAATGGDDTARYPRSRR